MPTEKQIEAAARAIAYEVDLDPDDERLGYPAWRIKWILAAARAALEAAAKVTD